MGESKIEWTNKTWNPIRGCSVVSEGCKNCYAMTFATRFAKPGEPYEGLAYRNESGAHWTGEVRLIERHLRDPITWKKPQMIFVNSMADLFHESIPDGWIDKIFGVMALTKRHTFQVLTKRPKRMRDYMARLVDLRNPNRFSETDLARWAVWEDYAEGYHFLYREPWPIPNVWLGVSVEDQKTADERIPLLLQTPAAVRWISAEPLLGPIDLTHLKDGTFNALDGIDYEDIRDIRDVGILGKGEIEGLDWVVAGAESGPKARPMDQSWVRSLKNQCCAADVPFFYKQDAVNGKKIPLPALDGQTWMQYPQQRQQSTQL